MSKYTTELRYIVDSWTTAPEGSSILEKIQGACPRIFNFDYPIWENGDKLQLETMIIQKYYMREIGFETVGLWQFYLCQKMMEIMPYYIKLWETTQAKYDFLTPFQFSETYTDSETGSTQDRGNSTSKTQQNQTDTSHMSSDSDTSGTGTDSNTTDRTIGRTGSDKTTSGSNTIHSDMPQATIAANTDYASASDSVTGNNDVTHKSDDVEKTVVAGNSANTSKTASTSDSAGTTTATTDITGTSENEGQHSRQGQHTITRSGNMGHTYSELLEQYRQSILMIPPLIVGELEPLFMCIW